jgi:hypothetical protein
MQQVQAVDFLAMRNPAGTSVVVSLEPSAPSIQNAIEVSNKISLMLSLNTLPGGMAQVDRYLTEGSLDVPAGAGERPDRNLMIQGIFEPEGTRIVRVDVSRESTANVFGPIKQRVKDNDEVVLVDAKGRPYSIIGYILERPDRSTRIELDPANYIRTSKLPQPPSSGGTKLTLLFNVTAGSTIAGLKYGDLTVGLCNVVAPGIKKAINEAPKVNDSPRGGGSGADKASNEPSGRNPS